MIEQLGRTVKAGNFCVITSTVSVMDSLFVLRIFHVDNFFEKDLHI